MSTQFWLENPNVLVQNLEIWPTNNMNSVQKYNAITRLILILTIIGYISTQSSTLLLISVSTLVIIIYLNNFQGLNKKQEKQDLSEGFVNTDLYDVIKPNLDESTKKNPFCNVMLDSESNKKIAPPSYNKEVENEINLKVHGSIKDNNNNNKDIDKLFDEIGDKDSFKNSMRSFHSMPNTQIPNDQAGFTEFCYGNLAKK